MLVCKWNKLPEEMQTEEVRPYWEKLRKKNISLLFKRLFDIIASFLLIILFLWLFVILAIAIKIDSKGPVFYRQIRITQYGKEFRIHKFRSMRVGADKGSLVTVNDDDRITKTGRFIRKFKLDEISQLLDVFTGKMTFVGTRPEVPKYVESYTAEMRATLLLPAGITSEASINFKDEADLLKNTEVVDEVYIKEILPKKMQWNFWSIKHYGFWKEIGVMFKTLLTIVGIMKPREFNEVKNK